MADETTPFVRRTEEPKKAPSAFEEEQKQLAFNAKWAHRRRPDVPSQLKARRVRIYGEGKRPRVAGQKMGEVVTLPGQKLGSGEDGGQSG